MRYANSLGIQDILETIVTHAVEAAGYRLVRFRLMGAKRKTLQVMAERPDGQMNVDDCTRLSRALGQVLEAADPIENEYVLEVSSPGIDRPLTRAEDFARFIGHEARIELTHALDGRKRFRGVLRELENNTVALDVAGEKGTTRMRFALSAIADAKLALTDRLIAESLKARDAKQEKARA